MRADRVVAALLLATAAIAATGCVREKITDVEVQNIPFSPNAGACLDLFADRAGGQTSACLYFADTPCVLTAELAGFDPSGGFARADWRRTCPEDHAQEYDFQREPDEHVLAELYVVPTPAGTCPFAQPMLPCDGSLREPGGPSECLAWIALEYLVGEDGALVPTERAGRTHSGYFQEELGLWDQPADSCSLTCDTRATSCMRTEVTLRARGGGAIRLDRMSPACTAECAVEFPAGRRVVLTAEAPSGGELGSWIGCDETAANVCALIAAEAGDDITAIFGYPVAIAADGPGRVTAPADLRGRTIACDRTPGAVCTGLYEGNASVALHAIGLNGGAFHSWDGCPSIHEDCALLVGAPAEVRAIFGYALNLHLSGDGTVTSTSFAGCVTAGGAADCSSTHLPREQVTLEATPGMGSVFDGWTGACAPNGNTRTCTIPINRRTDVGAAFHYEVRTTIAGEGDVDYSAAERACAQAPDEVCYAYAHDTMLTLTAIPRGTWEFAGWQGACSGGARECSLTVTRPLEATATFVATHVVTAVAGEGGTVLGPGISCAEDSGDCSERRAEGSMITLTAAPIDGWAFLEWIGCPEATGDVCSFTIEGDRTVEARFGRRLIVRREGRGVINLSPPGVACATADPNELCAVFIDATSVIVEASPLADWTFLEWDGECAGAGAICGIDMFGPRETTAAFGLACYGATFMSTAQPIAGINGALSSEGPSVRGDGLELYFGAHDSAELWSLASSARASAGETFGPGVHLAAFDVAMREELDPEISADGLEVFFTARPTDGTPARIACASRTSTSAAFGPEVTLAPSSTNTAEGSPALSADGLDLYFTAETAGDTDILTVRRAARGASCAAGWSTSEPAVAGLARDSDPALSADGRELFFTSDRDLANGRPSTIWVQRRARPAAPWDSPILLLELAGAGESGPALSADACTLYFDSTRSGGDAERNIWAAER